MATPEQHLAAVTASFDLLAFLRPSYDQCQTDADARWVWVQLHRIGQALKTLMDMLNQITGWTEYDLPLVLDVEHSETLEDVSDALEEQRIKRRLETAVFSHTEYILEMLDLVEQINTQRIDTEMRELEVKRETGSEMLVLRLRLRQLLSDVRRQLMDVAQSHFL